MATVEEILEAATFTEDREGIRRAVRQWRVMDPGGMDSVQAAAFVVVPRGSIHPSDSGMLSEGKQANPTPNWPFVWLVTVPYSSQVDEDTGESDQSIPPLDRAPKWEYPGENAFSEFVTEDIFLEPLLNAAGDPFPPQEVQRGGVQVSVTVWREYDSFDTRADYLDMLFHVNDDLWGEYNEWEAGEAYMTAIRPVTEMYGTTRYRRVTYIAVIKKGGWNTFLQNKGFNELFGGVKGAILDRLGNPVQEAVFLDPDGLQLDFNQDGTLDDDPVDLEFQLIESAPFPTQ